MTKDAEQPLLLSLLVDLSKKKIKVQFVLGHCVRNLIYLVSNWKILLNCASEIHWMKELYYSDSLSYYLKILLIQTHWKSYPLICHLFGATDLRKKVR